MTIKNRGISTEIHQWEEGGRVEVRTFDRGEWGGAGPKMVHIKVWMDYRPEEGVKETLNMTHYDINIPEDTAVAILQQLARMYPSACAEALGYEEMPDDCS